MSHLEPDPIHDAQRLQEIAELGLLSREIDPVLQQAAEEAASRLGLPISLVSIVLDEAQHFAASRGLTGWLAEVGGTPVEWSFCANSVRSGEPFVVEDAQADPRVQENPLVVHDGIRCYAGIPLISSRGHVLGNICVIGTEARTFAPDELEQLRAIAHRVVEQIEARRREAPVER